MDKYENKKVCKDRANWCTLIRIYVCTYNVCRNLSMFEHITAKAKSQRPEFGDYTSFMINKFGYLIFF